MRFTPRVGDAAVSAANGRANAAQFEARNQLVVQLSSNSHLQGHDYRARSHRDKYGMIRLWPPGCVQRCRHDSDAFSKPCKHWCTASQTLLPQRCPRLAALPRLSITYSHVCPRVSAQANCCRDVRCKAQVQAAITALLLQQRVELPVIRAKNRLVHCKPSSIWRGQRQHLERRVLPLLQLCRRRTRDCDTERTVALGGGRIVRGVVHHCGGLDMELRRSVIDPRALVVLASSLLCET